MGWGGLTYCNKAADLNLIAVWCYYCNRCNYVWLPKDFDIQKSGEDLLDREPPESCARCKSKYYNQEPRRTKRHRQQPSSMARFNALYREGQKKSSPEDKEIVDREYKRIVLKLKRNKLGPIL